MNVTTNTLTSHLDGERDDTLDRKDTETRIDAKSGLHENDDALIHNKIDEPNDIDKYSGYEVHDADDGVSEPKEGDAKKDDGVLEKSDNAEKPHNEVGDNAEKPHNEVGDKASIQIDNGNHTLSPGTRLRQARERSNMSIKHVADRLYLDARVIDALETDNYQGLPPTIFVRGYLRNYAKLLDISPESIMVAFDHGPQTSVPSLTAAPLKRDKQTSSKDLWPTVATIVIIVTLMTLMALWQYYPASTADETSLTGTPLETHESSWNAGFDQTVETGTGHSTEIGESNQPGEQDIKVSTTTVLSPPAVVSVIQSEDGASQIPSDKKEQTMRVHFKQRVWMKVTDKTGKQLYEGTGHAGKVLSWEALPPFKVKVGNTGVDIEYHGKTKNIKAYPGQKLTFTIGAE